MALYGAVLFLSSMSPPPPGKLVNMHMSHTVHQFSALFISGLKLSEQRAS